MTRLVKHILEEHYPGKHYNHGGGKKGGSKPGTSPILDFKWVQTFFVDSSAAGDATEVLVTSVELFCKKKPSRSNNTSGAESPGVVLSICEVVNHEPRIDLVVPGSTVRVDWEQIYSYSDASVATIFGFSTPVALETNKFYGIVVAPEDSSFQFWVNKTGDRLVGTNKPSSGSGNFKDGKYYTRTNAGAFTAVNDTDLKYRVLIAKFAANTASIILVNKDYEFLTISNRNGEFIGGEKVFQLEANATGNVSITAGNTQLVGTGTTFTDIVNGGYITVWNGTTNTQTIQVQLVTNTTHVHLASEPHFTNSATKFMITPVGRVYHKDDIDNKMYLVDSSANTSLKFDASATIIGDLSRANATISSIDNYSVDQFIPRFAYSTTSATTSDIQYVVSTGNTVSNSNFETAAMDKINIIDKYDGEILSRSNEVDHATLYGDTRKSAVVTFDFTVNQANTSLFNVPRIQTQAIDFITHQNFINNTYLSGNTDTEISKGGLATSKYISVKSSFANNRLAEDIRCYMLAHRPEGTSLRVYVKLHNSSDSEPYDDKVWTPLEYIQNGNTYSSATDKNDLVEYELGLPIYPESEFTVNGSFTTTLSNTVVVANGFDPSSNLAVDDLVKLYNPLIQENYTIAFVTAANSTTVTLSSAIANNNVVGSGYYIDKLRYTQTAFLNTEANSVVRYFTSTNAAVDKFDSMQLKIVMLSNSASIVPTVEEVQLIGLNAGT